MSTLNSLYYEARDADGTNRARLIHVAEDLADGEVMIELHGVPVHAYVSGDAIELYADGRPNLQRKSTEE